RRADGRGGPPGAAGGERWPLRASLRPPGSRHLTLRGAKAEESRSGEAGLALVALLGAAFIRCLRATLRLRFHGEGEGRRKERAGGHFILPLWAPPLLLLPYAYRGKRMHVLSSHSFDGELMVRTLSHFGIGTVRGSSTR